MRELRPLFSRIYEADPGRAQYRNQLNNWCSRVKIRNIAFETMPTKYFTEDGKRLYRAIPICERTVSLPNRVNAHRRHQVPRLDQGPQSLGRMYVGHGRSMLDAQRVSLRILERARLNIDMTLVRWHFSMDNEYHIATPYLYAGPALLWDASIIGWGTTKREAKELSARALLQSRRYCVTW